MQEYWECVIFLMRKEGTDYYLFDADDEDDEDDEEASSKRQRVA